MKSKSINIAAKATQEERKTEPAKDQAVAPVAQPFLTTAADHNEFAEYADAGFQNVTPSDLLIPRITILQALSPQLSRSEPEYIKEAHSGDICDVAMGEIYSDLLFLPVYYRKDYMEWAPRSEGRKFPVAIHNDDRIYKECHKDEKGIFWHGKNKIAETAQFFGFNVSAMMRKCFIPMTGTQFKKAKRWLHLATGEKLKRADGSFFTPPLFYRTYKLGVAEEKNNEGNWFGWTIERGPTLPELTADEIGIAWRELKTAAAEFQVNLIKGEYKADLTEEAAGEDTTPREQAAM
jgi:hypothetical protein